MHAGARFAARLCVGAPPAFPARLAALLYLLMLCLLPCPALPCSALLPPPLLLQVIPGLDEALLTMSSGCLRRLYIPGNLAFPKGLPAGGWAAGRWMCDHLLVAHSQALGLMPPLLLPLPPACHRSHCTHCTRHCPPTAPTHPRLRWPLPLRAAAGRPRVAPASPVMFDVKLLRIPGVTDDDEDEQ